MGPVWRHDPWTYPEPYPPVGTPCPTCRQPFEYPPWVTERLVDEHGNISAEAARAYEDFRGIFFDMALICEIDKGLDGFGNPVRRRDLDDARWVHAGERGWLEGQDATGELGLET